MDEYAPLWCKSNFSFLEGASHAEELIEETHRLGMSSIAISDRDGVYGMIRAHVKAKELGVHLVCGAQMTVAPPSTRLASSPVTVALHGGPEPSGGRGPGWGIETHELPPHIPIPRRPRRPETAMRPRARGAADVPREARLRERAIAAGLPIVAATEVLYPSRARRPLQDILTCIRHGATLATAGRLLRGNDEHDLRAPHAFARLYSDDTASVARTLDIAARCTFSLGELRYRYPSERLPDGTTSAQYLRKLVLEGAAWRYGGDIPANLRTQLRAQH